MVVPLVGTWIETTISPQIIVYHVFVVPLVGTWIETTSSMTACRVSASFPLWERGLKPSPVILVFDRRPPSFPLWERGLKRLYGYSEDDTILVVPLAETCIET